MIVTEPGVVISAQPDTDLATDTPIGLLLVLAIRKALKKEPERSRQEFATKYN